MTATSSARSARPSAAPAAPSPAEALAALPLFAGLAPDDLARVAAATQVRRFRKGAVIFHRGDPGTTLFIVAAGRIKITAPTEDGDEAMLAVMRPGDLIGELSVLDGAPRSATAIALEPVTLWAIGREALLALLNAMPLAGALLTALAGRLRRTNLLVEELSCLGLDPRMARVLLRLAEEHGVETPEGIAIDLPITQTDLAAMVGATRPPVNLLLGAYQDAGLIRLVGRTIVLRDIAGLRARAGLWS